MSKKLVMNMGTNNKKTSAKNKAISDDDSIDIESFSSHDSKKKLAKSEAISTKSKVTSTKSKATSTKSKVTSTKSKATSTKSKVTSTKSKATSTKSKTAPSKSVSDGDEDSIDIESFSSSDSKKRKGTEKKTKTNPVSKKDDSDDEKPKGKKTTKVESTLVDVNKSVSRKMNKGKGSYILVIVESPGKIKKLESILGPGYCVDSSFGHIMDLHPKKMSVDFDNKFDPEYHIISGAKKFQDKTKVVKQLIAKASKASKVIIAADHDREGEMIGWSYKVALGLGDDDYERITFNSITKEEVKKAIANPGKLDMLMVDSQKTRRILDRIVGFKISPGLNQIMGMRNLSAGRVQSIVVRLICEKEQEITNFFEGDNASYFKVVGTFLALDTQTKKSTEMKCDLYTDLAVKADDDNEEKDENDDEAQDQEDRDQEDGTTKMTKAKLSSFKTAEKLMNNITKSTFKVSDVSVRQSKRCPSPPFTTSTAQQDASTKLGFNVKRTMTALQRLYEAGYTTYLRTDSTNLSDDALKQCTDFIKENYGDDYHNLKNYTNKKGNTQEAHEAIRPVDVKKKSVPCGGKIGSDEQKMYQLVWKRTIASQMCPAEVDVHTVEISVSKEKNYFFRTSIDDITFPGYLAVYNIGVHGQDFDTVDKKFKLLIPKKGQICKPVDVKCSEEYKKPPLRYSEAGLVKKMDPKNLNIGRPATYAEVINTIQKRNYVEIKDVDGFEKKSRTLSWIPETETDIVLEEKKVHIGREKKKFCPTPLGTEVNSILMRTFPEIMEYQFTANMETELDQIAEGTKGWVSCLEKFWKKLKPMVDKMDMEKKTTRILGKNPETGYEVFASMGLHGPMLTMPRSEKKSENATAPIKLPLTLEKITLKQALKILKYPMILGTDGKKIVELKTGKHGYYVTCGKNSANIPADVNPDEIDLEVALKYMADKQKQYAEKMSQYLYYHKDGDIEYIVNKGKYGENNRYLMIKDLLKKKDTKPTFLPFPSDEGLEDLTIERVKELAEEGRKKKWQKKKDDKDSVDKKEGKKSVKKTKKVVDSEDHGMELASKKLTTKSSVVKVKKSKSDTTISIKKK
jgi:DNA topoisomerase-1